MTKKMTTMATTKMALSHRIILHRGGYFNRARHYETMQWLLHAKVGMPSPEISFAHTRILSVNQIRNHSASITAAAASSTIKPSIRGNNPHGDGEGGNDNDGGERDLSIAGKIFFSSLCLFTFSLGIWQTQRYFEKVDMVQKRKDDLRLNPLLNYYDWLAFKEKKSKTNDDDSSITANTSFRRVYLRGTFQHENELFIGPRGPPPGALAETGPNSGRGGGGGGMSSSMQGYAVVTPFVILKDSVNEDSVTRHGSSSSQRNDVSQSSQNLLSDTSQQQEDVVWINRGWIPRHFLNRNTHAPKNFHHHHGPQPHNYTELITSYSQPSGIIQLLAMESNTDTPGRFAPPSRLESSPVESKIRTLVEDDAPTTTTTATTSNNAAREGQPPTRAIIHKKLLWMDRAAMEELTSCPSDSHPPLFVEIHHTTNDGMVPSQEFPVKPAQEYVGEFKVTPEIHAGYAVTWFGLSGAGMFMTKKLLSRGRW